MQYLVEAHSAKKKQFVEHILPNMLKQLGLTRSRKTLLIRLANECGDQNDGMTMPLDGIDSYVVVVRPGTLAFIGETLAHEMVHVKQYARGQITHGKNLKSKFWMGQRIKSQYYDSPWEIEAYSKERVLANKIFKIIDTAHAKVKKQHKK